VEAFPVHERKQSRLILAAVLRGVVAQRLVPRADGHGRVPAVEVLTNYERMFEAIADEERSSRIQELIVEGSFHGCKSFDQALLKLYEDGVIEFHDAVANATDPTGLKLAVQAMGVRSA
jgi:twitching motility protein PilT